MFFLEEWEGERTWYPAQKTVISETVSNFLSLLREKGGK
jgi:hypothetical protein